MTLQLLLAISVAILATFNFLSRTICGGTWDRAAARSMDTRFGPSTNSKLIAGEYRRASIPAWFLIAAFGWWLVGTALPA